MAALHDAGTKPAAFYKARLGPRRYRLRQTLLPYVRRETLMIGWVQRHLRTPWLDFYFAWTANLALHTFYVLMLPLPIWYGGEHMTRDLVMVLGFGIYFTGTLKDYVCLPRPALPPCHRITMSGYTTREYGFPLSHSANATGVTLLLAMEMARTWADRSVAVNTVLAAVLGLYYLLLIFGRVYCGMHGPIDIATGSAVGVLVVCGWRLVQGAWDTLVFGGSWLAPVVMTAVILAMVHFHAEPADDCPCFDDLVAFVGVVLGFEMSFWLFAKWNGAALFEGVYAQRLLQAAPVVIPFDGARLGLVRAACRLVVGVAVVVAWKSAAKPIMFAVLPPVYKALGVSIARSGFEPAATTKALNAKIRRSSVNMEDKVANLGRFVRAVGDTAVEDKVGDVEVVHERLRSRAGSGVSRSRAGSDPFAEPPAPPRPRYDVEVMARLVVYAGVSALAVWGFSAAVVWTPFV